MKICKLGAILFSGLFSGLSIASAYSIPDKGLVEKIIESYGSYLSEKQIIDDFNRFNSVGNGLSSDYKKKSYYISDLVPLILEDVVCNVVTEPDEGKFVVGFNLTTLVENKDKRIEKASRVFVIISYWLSCVIKGEVNENGDIPSWIYYTFDGPHNYDNGRYKNIEITDEDINEIIEYAQGAGFKLGRYFKEKYGEIITKIQLEYFFRKNKGRWNEVYDFTNLDNFQYLKLYIDYVFARLYKGLRTNQFGGKITNLLKDEYNLKVKEEYRNAAKKNYTMDADVDRELFYMFIQKGLSNYRWRSLAEMLKTFSSKSIEYFIEQPGVYEEMFEFSDSNTELRLGYNKMHYIIAMLELNRSLFHCRIKVPVREWRQGMKTIFVDYFEKKKFKVKTAKDYNLLFKAIKAANKENIDSVLGCRNVKDYGHFVPFDTEVCDPEDGFQIMTILNWALTNREWTHIDTGDYPSIEYNPSLRLDELNFDLKTVKERVFSFYSKHIIEALEKEASKQNPMLFGEYFEKVKEEAIRRYENDMCFLGEDKARKNAAMQSERSAKERERYAQYLATRGAKKSSN